MLDRWWGVRTASALSAAAFVAVSMALAGLALIVLQDRAVRSQVIDQARGTGQVVERELEAGATPAEAVRASLGAFAVVQVVDAGGKVLAASPDLGSAPRLRSGEPARPSPDVEGTDADEMGLDVDDGPLLVLAREAHTPSGVLTVLAAGSLAPVERSTRSAAKLAVVGVPLAALLAAFATYAFTGRALRPVERIRASVAALTDRDLDRRVAVPAAHDEIGRLARTMNDMLGRLQAARTAQRRFVADAGHELRSPLATIMARLELAQRRGPSNDDVVAMLPEAQRMARLVDDLLLLARADERGLRLDRAEVDLDDVVEAEVGRRRERAGVDVSGETVPVRVHGDRARLARAVGNLVDNAVRHARSRVVVRLRSAGGSALLEVIDDGPGIPLAERRRVFERFVRLDDARARDSGGTGLGLAIVAEVVTVHGGRVEAGEAEGGGARLAVVLPAQHPVVSAAEPVARSGSRSR